MFATKHQQRVLDAQTPTARSIRLPRDRLGITEGHINKVNTDVFKNFVEALELMAQPDYYQIFKGRFKRHDDKVWELTRLIRAHMKQARDSR